MNANKREQALQKQLLRYGEPFDYAQSDNALRP